MGMKAKNICEGDAGGPLMVENPHGFELVGVASFWGPTCGDEFPGVYANIEGHERWIKKIATDISAE